MGNQLLGHLALGLAGDLARRSISSGYRPQTAASEDIVENTRSVRFRSGDIGADLSELVETGETHHPQPFENTKARTGARASERGQYRTASRKGIWSRIFVDVKNGSTCRQAR
ncbi:MAG: hypothetical protein OXK81_10600 [Chloroflexota bacterium]|nr:hypothetical protein [Chloroflexota bacterium]